MARAAPRVTPALDERTQRRARSRAQAAAILDGERVPRNFAPAPVAPRPSERRRTSRPASPRKTAVREEVIRPRIGRKHVAIALAILQLGGLVALFVLPAFRASTIDIRGTALLDRGAVLRAAHLQNAPSIFRVDGEEIRSRLLQLPWVGSASVQTALPNRISIQITENAPVLHLHAAGRDLLVAATGATLPLASARARAAAGIPLVSDERPDAAGLKVAANRTLMRLLAEAAQRFPPLFGCSVTALRWTADGIFTITTSSGWRAVIGHLATRADVDALPDQLTALLSLKSTVDFVHPKFGYIDVENPQTPVVGGAPGAAPPTLHLPAAAPAATVPAKPVLPGPAAASAPAVAPSPSSNVHTFSLPPPSPHG
ncbi:MAG: hypothetical protein NVSMB29_13030 [Candidatus Dormibacteria bacterium]